MPFETWLNICDFKPVNYYCGNASTFIASYYLHKGSSIFIEARGEFFKNFFLVQSARLMHSACILSNTGQNLIANNFIQSQFFCK